MRHNEKSENIARGRRLLVVASQTVGVVAVHRPHRRPNPFISGQSLHFQKTGALGDTMFIPLSQTVRVLRREQIVTSATRRAHVTLFWNLSRNPDKFDKKIKKY